MSSPCGVSCLYLEFNSSKNLDWIDSYFLWVFQVLHNTGVLHKYYTTQDSTQFGKLTGISVSNLAPSNYLMPTEIDGIM